MTVTIGTFSTNSLTAQPLGYEGDSRDGLTSRRWRIAGLLAPAEWDDLITEYDTWRDLRVTDLDTLASGTVGTTVSFSGVGFGSTGSWSAVPCWFASAPTAEQAGSYISVTTELVDAIQALEVLLRQKEKQRQAGEERPNFGTITLGTVTLAPLDPPDGRVDVPTPALTAAGRHYLTGSLGITKTRRVRAYTDASDYATLRTWFDTTVSSTPAAGSWFPTSFPEPTAEIIIEDGAKTTRYTVELSLTQIR